ncbi:MAG: flagellar biosynthesis protein FlhB [Hyphomonadaceae bacterium]
MAEDQDNSQKTEDPTPKRLEDARKKGDIAKSQEVPIWFMLLAAAGILAAAGPLAHGLMSPLASMIDHPHAFSLAGDGARKLMYQVGMAILTPLMVVFGVLAVSSFLGHLIQHRPLWTTEKMKPDLSKLSPMKGLGRIFGPQGLMNLVKAVLKLTAIVVAMLYAVWPLSAQIRESGRLDVAGILHLLQSVSGRLFIAAVVVVGIVAAIDYIYQRQSFMNRMKMSRRDVRDEHKQSEGDPQVKARLRAIRMERSRRRMLAAVKESTVVVTNPTHYSVALRYDPDKDAAPICVAKGVDELALRIRETAREAEVPIVENVSLARALYATTDVDEMVPREHFEAVAKVIGFVLNTAKNRDRRPN